MRLGMHWAAIAGLWIFGLTCTQAEEADVRWEAQSAKSHAEYADCAFIALEENSMNVRKTELSSKGVFYIDGLANGVRQWRIQVLRSGKGSTVQWLGKSSNPLARLGEDLVLDPLKSCL